MSSLQSTAVDVNYFSPSTWPDYSVTKMRIGWVKENSKENGPPVLEFLTGLSVFRVQTLDWAAAKQNLSEVVHFFEQIEVLISLSEYNTDPVIISMAAAMGRAVITDTDNLFPFNHGETGLVVFNDAKIIAEGLLFLRNDATLRGSIGKNLRQKYMKLQQGRD